MIKFNDAKEFELLWRSNGYQLQEIEQEDKSKKNILAQVDMKDALASPDAPYFFQVTVENFVREAIEPILLGTKLLQRINYKAGQMITLPSIGAMYAADIDEGAEYPERSLNFGPGVRIATIGKSGLAVKFTEEMIRYSQYDVVALNLRAAGRAMARHKESKIWYMLSKVGTTTHDNVTPGSSVFGTTTGRGIDGAANGSVNIDDIYEMWGQLMMNGFVGNALIVHPMTFIMFATDPYLRHLAYQGMGGAYFNGPAGISNPEPWAAGALGKFAPQTNEATHPLALAGNYSPNIGLNQGVTEGLKLPNYFGMPLQVIVSPYVPYDPATRITDIYMVDTNNMGAIIVDEEPTMDTIEDKLRDLRKIKIRERYAIAPLNDGKGICVMKNVKVTGNQLLTPVLGVGPTINSAVDRTTTTY